MLSIDIILNMSFFTFGYIFEIVSKYIGELILFATIITIIIIYSYIFIKRKNNFFLEYHLYILILNFLSLYILLKMIEDVITGDMITRFDVWLNKDMVLISDPVLTQIMLFITKIANPLNLFILSIILFGILVYKKKWYYSLLLLFSMIGGLLIEVLIKLIIHRERPENLLFEVVGYSFPSGHATMATIFFSLLLYSFKDDIKDIVLKNVFIISNIIVFLLVGLSRVYLNVHWFSDVLAGFALGVFWLTLLILVFRGITFMSNKKKNNRDVNQKYSRKKTGKLRFIEMFDEDIPKKRVVK